MEAVQLTDAMINKLDEFQMKGLRTKNRQKADVLGPRSNKRKHIANSHKDRQGQQEEQQKTGRKTQNRQRTSAHLQDLNKLKRTSEGKRNSKEPAQNKYLRSPG